MIEWLPELVLAAGVGFTLYRTQGQRSQLEVQQVHMISLFHAQIALQKSFIDVGQKFNKVLDTAAVLLDKIEANSKKFPSKNSEGEE